MTHSCANKFKFCAMCHHFSPESSLNHGSNFTTLSFGTKKYGKNSFDIEFPIFSWPLSRQQFILEIGEWKIGSGWETSKDQDFANILTI